MRCPECGETMNRRFDAGRSSKLHGYDCSECKIFAQPDGRKMTEYTDGDGEMLKERTVSEPTESKDMTDLTETETVTDYETNEVEREMFNCPICPLLERNPLHEMDEMGVPVAFDPDTENATYTNDRKRKFTDAKAVGHICETCAEGVFDYTQSPLRSYGRKREHLRDALTETDPTSFNTLNLRRYLALCAGACALALWTGVLLRMMFGLPLLATTLSVVGLWATITILGILDVI